MTRNLRRVRPGGPRPGTAWEPTRTLGALLLALALPLLLAAPRAQAAGYGGYFEYLHAEGKIDFEGFVDDEHYDADKFGVGLVFDTSLARDRLFNYRLTIGYQHMERDFDSFGYLDLDDLDLIDEVEANGVSINNIFGFGLYRSPRVRFWMGPSIRLGVDVFDTGEEDVDVVDVNIGIGPSVGLNIHTSEKVTVGLTAGYQYIYVGEIVEIDSDFGDDTDGYDGEEHLVSVNLTVFFRTKSDRFE